MRGFSIMARIINRKHKRRAVVLQGQIFTKDVRLSVAQIRRLALALHMVADNTDAKDIQDNHTMNFLC